MITLAPKEFSIQGMHSLDIEGIAPKCKRQHGHTYWVRVWFRGNPNDDGVLVPYETVSEVAGKYDHQNLNEVMESNSTGENLLIELVDGFRERLSEMEWRPRLKRIELVEAPTRSGGHLLVWDADEQGMNEAAKLIRGMIANVDALVVIAEEHGNPEAVPVLGVRRSALNDALESLIG